MFKNYLLVMLRHMSRQRAYSAINIVGLAIGIAVTTMILLYVNNELGYDTFHENVDNLYRVNIHTTMSNQERELALSMGPLAEAVKNEIVGIEAVTRIDQINQYTFEHDGKEYEINSSFRVDPDFLKMFSFDLLLGDRETALAEPNSIVLSKSMSEKIFGDFNSVGQTLNLYGNDYLITGIAQDPPTNTQFNYEALYSIGPDFDAEYGAWGAIGIQTYILLEDGRLASDINAGIQQTFDENLGNVLKTMGMEWSIYLFPVKDIHLKSEAFGELNETSSYQYLAGLTVIALFILFLACINFINLSTARSAKRAREVGMRKVLGAYRSNLIRQFLGESISYAFIAVVLAMFLIVLFLPHFNDLAGREIKLSALMNPIPILSLAGMVVFIGLISGSFPAIYLSAFQPTKVLKGGIKSGKQKNFLRRALVISQFIISIGLIVATVTVYKQLNYLQNKRLGFDSEQVLVLEMGENQAPIERETLYHEFGSIPGVESVSLSNGVPFGGRRQKTILQGEHILNNQPFETWIMAIDHNFLKTFNIKLKDGRDFDPAMGTDANLAVIVNETAVRDLGWKDEAIGKELPIRRVSHRIRTESRAAQGEEVEETAPPSAIIGVMEDFHYSSLQNPIEPICLFIDELDPPVYLSIKLDANQGVEKVDEIKAKWAGLFPNQPFDPTFLDERLNQLYEGERRFGRMVTTFAMLAMFIAALGLFGLASYAAEVRTKEISVRKVLGASEKSLIVLLTREFTWLVLISALIASPIAWYLINKWLSGFAYRIGLEPSIFVISTLLTLLLAWLSVGYQAFRAARTNPIDALKYE